MTARQAVRIAAMIVLATPSAVSAQASASDIREVLETSQVRDVLGSAGSHILAGARAAVPDIDTLRLARIVDTHFLEDSLIAEATRYLGNAASGDILSELRAWLLADSIRTLEGKANAASEAESLEQFAERLQARRPSAERIQLAARFTEIQRAGHFYVRYLTELQAATEAITAAVLGTVPQSQQPSAAQMDEAVQQFNQVATVSFLQRFEPLTDQEVLRLIAAYESRSGTWYIASYTEAVAFAISEATKKVVAALN
jgi:hypothetical protein